MSQTKTKGNLYEKVFKKYDIFTDCEFNDKGDFISNAFEALLILIAIFPGSTTKWSEGAIKQLAHLATLLQDDFETFKGLDPIRKVNLRPIFVMGQFDVQRIRNYKIRDSDSTCELKDCLQDMYETIGPSVEQPRQVSSPYLYLHPLSNLSCANPRT